MRLYEVHRETLPALHLLQVNIQNVINIYKCIIQYIYLASFFFLVSPVLTIPSSLQHCNICSLVI